MFDRALVHLQFNDFLLNVVSIQFSLGICINVDDTVSDVVID